MDSNLPSLDGIVFGVQCLLWLKITVQNAKQSGEGFRVLALEQIYFHRYRGKTRQLFSCNYHNPKIDY